MVRRLGNRLGRVLRERERKGEWAPWRWPEEGFQVSKANCFREITEVVRRPLITFGRVVSRKQVLAAVRIASWINSRRHIMKSTIWRNVLVREVEREGSPALRSHLARSCCTYLCLRDRLPWGSLCVLRYYRFCGNVEYKFQTPLFQKELSEHCLFVKVLVFFLVGISFSLFCDLDQFEKNSGSTCMRGS